MNKELDIEAIKERRTALPELPWLASDILDDGRGGVISHSNKIIIGSGIGMPLSRFFAAAPTDIAALVTEVERLREELDLTDDRLTHAQEVINDAE